MDKTSLKKALLEVKEIETFATNSAKKLMEQEFLPKIEKSVKQALLEMEQKEMEEASEITLDSGASVNVTVDSNGKVTIKSGDGTAPAVVSGAPEIPSTPEVVSTELPATTSDVAPVIPSITPEVGAEVGAGVEDVVDAIVPDESEVEPEVEDELFEIVDDSEDVPVVDDENEEVPVEDEVPVEEVPTEEEPVEDEAPVEDEGGEEMEMGTEEPVEGGEEAARLEKIESDVEEMKGLLEKILEKVGEAEDAEGEVEIVDDEPTGEEMGTEDEFAGEAGTEDGFGDEQEFETEELPTEEVPGEEEEIFFEFDDVLDESKNKDLQEIKQTLSEIEELEESLKEETEEELEEGIEMKDLEEALREVLGAETLEEYGEEHPVTVKDALTGKGEQEELFELEIQDGEVEESMSVSFSNKQGNNLKPNTPHKKERTGLSESDKAQYESKMDELKNENESLKVALKEYKDSFVVLRKQINEVQTFNAKLAYANKVFTKGGLTNEEKVVISEQFDSCKNAEEAKALYNKLIKESTVNSKPNVNKIKLPKAASTDNSAEKGTLYENDETKRMRKLAGIIK